MNELDKIFKSKLENHTAEFSDQSWDKIQARLPKQSTKPKKYPWLWVGLIAGIALVGLWTWNSTENSLISNVEVDKQADLANNFVSQRLTSLESSNPNSDIEIIENKNNRSNIIEATNENSLEASSIVEENLLRNSMENETLEKIGINSSSSYTGIGSQKKTIGNGIQNIVLEPYNDIKSQQKEFENDKFSLINKTNEALSSEGIISSSTISPNEIKSQGLTTLINTRPLRTIGVSAFTTLQSEKQIKDLILSKSMLDDFRQDCPSFVTDRTGVYLDFYVSHELPFSNLKSKGQDQNDYKELRANSEGPTYSFSAGARLTLMLPNGLGLKTGINYSQVNEQFSHIDADSDMVQEVITITTVNGMEVRDTNTVVIPGTRDVVSTNKYRSFDIPLLLSYEWDVRERTYMTVNGGAYLNLLFKESGKILSPGGEVIDLADTSGDNISIFKNNIGLSLFGSVGIHYRMNSNIDLILEPNMRMVVKSATVDAYSLDHKWLTLGLITGMRYNF